ncbi:MAG: dihydrolipoyl dehydrogenase [Dehalococcoidia bacterium]|nr:dihydrolipoyl dehydrogenase [Dehalococcoidia bacterium]
MEQFEVLVLGSGCGLDIARQAGARGMKTALIEPGALGGTCVNVGCIPSKMLIAPADCVAEIEHGRRLGVRATVESVDFAAVMRRMRTSRAGSQQHLRHSIQEMEGVRYVKGTGRFVRPGVVQVGREQFTAPLIFVAAGARPLVPRIAGLEDVDYLTNESLLQLRQLPESLIIMGGGYIAVEFCHFFAAMGTRVTVLEMADRLVTSEEPEISSTLQQELSKRARIVTGAKVESVSRHGSGISVAARMVDGARSVSYRASHLLVAVGRRPNTDVVAAERGGIKVDTKGFIEVDGRLRTSQRGVYAVGDINGKAMFRHAANVQAVVAGANAFDGQDIEMDYHAIPHAVYSWPQVASVGLTEAQSRDAGMEVTTSLTPYSSVAKGEAIAEVAGFTKVVMQKDSEMIVGFHIIGPHAPILIQEVVNAMQSGGNLDEIARGVHIHPELTELIPTSFEGLE